MLLTTNIQIHNRIGDVIHITTNAPMSPLTTSPSETRIKQMKVFLDYLRHLIPLVKDGFAMHVNSPDPILRRVAVSPDRLLPFRQKAPTAIKASQVIYGNRDRLRTRVGLFNALMFRGVFYGSPFAKDDLVWFNSLDEWHAFYQTSKRKAKGSDLSKPATKERYFVNKSAYGPNQPARSTEVAKTYWKESEGWETFIKANHDAKEMFDWLVGINSMGKKRFPNIGPLCALLVLGDLIKAECQIFPMPTSSIWGELVHELNKGARNGLVELGLQGKIVTSEVTSHSFQELNQYLEEQLDDEEKSLIGFNVISLEHGLCKQGRILPRRRKRNET